MVHWPPSPLVEDEVTALSHEHGSGQKIKTEDDPVVSRGTVDQYPIIVDSDDQREAVKSIPNDIKQNHSEVLDRDISDDSSGQKTPLPLNERRQRRPSPPFRNKSVSFGTQNGSEGQQKRSKDDARSRGRSEVSHIQTNLGDDLRAMASGQRRAPSPYSYTRTGTKDPLSPSSPRTEIPEVNLAASTATSQPNTLRTTSLESGMDDATRYARRKTGTLDHVHQDTTQRAERQISGSETDSFYSRRNTVRRRSSDTEQMTAQHTSRRRNLPHDTSAMTPPRSRRVSQESSYGSTVETRVDGPRTAHTTRQTSAAHDSPQASPYTSSAEEGRESPRHKQQIKPDHNANYMVRPSSERRERPRMDDLKDRMSFTRGSQFATIDDLSFVQSPELKTPSTTEAVRKATEDYFEQALRDNFRKSGQGRSQRTNASTHASPHTSPPRTPRSERQSRDYLDLGGPVSKPVQRSRPPSIDEGHVKDPRAHPTLLSAATAGAALAARSSGEFSKSGSSSTEHSSSNSTSKPTSTPRSRRPSPVSEEARPATGAMLSAPQGATGSRPVSRGSLQMSDRSGFQLPQRAASTSMPVPASNSRFVYAASPIEARHGLPVSHTSPTTPVSQSYAQRKQGPTNMPDPNFLSLPSCPRSQPTTAHSDWWSIKELSHLDVCPTCVSVVANTSYRDLFIRSLPRPYNEPSVCAMSKPWLRIAFMQSLRRGRPNLDYLRAVSMLPANVSPCKGEKPEQRRWFRIEDPSTRALLPNFMACTACVRAVDNIFPELSEVFTRPRDLPLAEGVCSLNVQNKNFACFIDLLERTASRGQDGRVRSREVQSLIDHIREATRHPQCAKDRLLASRLWHFIPDLPEFTVCEACYKEVIWPVRDEPIAREVPKFPELVPVRQASANSRALSCQLYSNRMRKIFHEAVAMRNFSHLRDAARARYDVQQRLLNQNKLYEQDRLLGIDRRAELAKNANIWRSWE